MLQAAATIRYIEAEGHQMAVRGFNEDLPGTPLIFLHGITLTLDIAPLILPHTLRERRWYSVSLPGHFPARFAPGTTLADLSVPMLVRQLAATLDEITGTAPVDLFGYSTGAFLGTAFAAHYPARVRSLTAAAGFIQGHWQGGMLLFQRLARAGRLGAWLFEAAFRWLRKQNTRLIRSYYDATVQRDAFRAFLARHPEMNDLLDGVRQQSPQAMRYWFAWVLTADLSPLLPRITAPTFVIVGAEDPIVRVGDSVRLAEATPNQAFIRLPNTGHLLFAEAPEAWQQHVETWFTTEL